MRWHNRLLLLGLISSAHAAYVVTPTGRQITGAKLTATAEGSVTLTTADGQSMTFRKGQYQQAVADKPPSLLQAEHLLKKGAATEAIPLLQQVQSEYRFLAWDQTATVMLANHYFETEQFAAAARAFQTLEDPDSTAQVRCREALLKAGNRAAVLPMLGTDIASGSRAVAAQAYLLRGDLKAAEGDLAGARRDWLKVVTFFKAQKELATEAESRMLNNELKMVQEAGDEQ